MDTIFARLLHLRSDDAHEDALRIMLELGIQSVRAEEGSVLILDKASKDLVFVMTAGDMLSESGLKGQRVQLAEGLTGTAAKTGVVQTGSPASVPLAYPVHHDEHAPSHLIAAPIRAENTVLGVLTAATYKPGRKFTTNEVQMFERVAALACIVLADRQRSRFAGDPFFGVSRPR